MIYQQKTKILENLMVAPEHYAMTLKSAKIVKIAKPGQFVFIRCSDDSDALLRRAFSFYKIDSRKGAFSIIYKKVGIGTNWLSKLNAGETLDVLGPLGNGFVITAKSERIFIVGGGVGIPPLYALAQKLIKIQNRKAEVFLGAKNIELVLCTEEFKKLNYPVIIATEDGKYGFCGDAVCLFKEEFKKLAKDQILKTRVFACGKTQMLEALVKFLRPFRVPIQTALEARMACGVGACLSCVVNTKNGLKRVCADGPVFDGYEIDWESVKI
jgi:dihydroorotate dehydrogenase electron transfer subunit